MSVIKRGGEEVRTNQKGGSASEALVENGAHTPQVCLVVVWLPQEDLRGLHTHTHTHTHTIHTCTCIHE